MKLLAFFILVLVVNSTLAFEGQDSGLWQNLQFSKSEKAAPLPAEYQSEMKALTRKFSGRESDFFSEIGWNTQAKKVMIWAPQLNFKNIKKPFYKIGSMIFLNLEGGGVLFCKGCLWAEDYQNASLINLFVRPARAEPACEKTDSYKGLRDIDSVIKKETAERNIFDSLKTCHWSATEMIKKTYVEAKQIVSDIASGTMFRDLLTLVTGLESALIQFRDKVAPMLASMREHLSELYDHMVCEFSQSSLRAIAMGIVIPGGGSAGATAKIAINVQKLKKNLELMSKNQNMFATLIGLKDKHGGKLPPHLLSAISEIRHDIPVKPKAFSNSPSLERHFMGHSELHFKSSADYEKAALRFAENKSPTAMVLESKADKHWVKFDPATKEYAVMNRKGEMITYFKKDRFTSEQAFERFLQEHSQ